jgi:hypothetical protein
MPPLLNHPCCWTVESMVITWREVYHCKKKRALPGLTFTEPHLDEPVRPASVLQGLGCCATEAWSVTVSCTDLSNSTMDALIRTLYLCGMGDGDRRRRLWVCRELRVCRFFLFSPRAWRDGGYARRGADELREAVFYPVYVGEFAVVNDRHLPCGEKHSCCLVCWLLPFNTKESIERVHNPLDLFDTGALH